MLTAQIRHYELCQKISRYANFSDFFTLSYAIFDFVKKDSIHANFSTSFTPSYAIVNCVQTILDMLVLVLYLPPAMPF